MLVKFLDLKTGRRETHMQLSEYDLTEGNWSCDCNRILLFDELPDSGTCLGCHRFIVYDIEASLDGLPIDKTELIRESNIEYYINLNNATAQA